MSVGTEFERDNVATGEECRVTVIFTIRERFETTLASLQAIVENAGTPFRLICGLVQPPDGLIEAIQTLSKTVPLELAVYETWRWPAAVRSDLSDAVETEYLCFIDNDVLVSENWLSTLIAAADATGAGIVGPLYLRRDATGTDRVHMAGGLCDMDQGPPLKIRSKHVRRLNAEPTDLTDRVEREPVDFVEYHCLLMRRSVARLPTVFGLGPATVTEHVHTSLIARENGYATVLEPESQVIYLACTPFLLSSLPFFRKRWSLDDAGTSSALFLERWSAEHCESDLNKHETFTEKHLSGVDLLKPMPERRAERSKVLLESGHCQIPSQLIDLLERRGYTPLETETILAAHQLAQTLCNGVYRGCGRPWINHLIGTAGVLAHYGFRADTIVAALLYSAYVIRPLSPKAEPIPTLAVDKLLQPFGDAVKAVIRSHAERHVRWRCLASAARLLEEMLVSDAEVLAISAAAYLDWDLGGEKRYTAPPDRMTLEIAGLMRHAFEALEVPGLFRSLPIPPAAQFHAGQPVDSAAKRPYRLSGGRKLEVRHLEPE